MKPLPVTLVAIAVLGVAVLADAQNARPAAASQTAAPKPAASQPLNPVAEAYSQFLLAHQLESDEDIEGAIAAYKRAITLDPQSAEVISELADFYLRQDRIQEAMTAAEQALKVSSSNRQAHRVLGTIYASLATGGANQRGGRETARENITRAIQHLEQTIEGPMGRVDANLRAMLARLYVGNADYDKAIPILAELVRQEPQWQDGASLLVEAYSAAGRPADAIRWLEEAVGDAPRLYATLADFYARERQWRQAANAYEQALQVSPRSVGVRVGYASALLNLGGKDDLAKARNSLREAVGIRATDESALYLLSQAERRMGDLDAAESAARRLVAQNGRNVRGFLALAEALEDRRRYQAVIDALSPALPVFRTSQNSAFAMALLLPHLGFAYQQVGQFDRALATFEEARKISPDDVTLTGYLIQANLAAKKFTEAAELARQARRGQPDNLSLARLEAEALRQSGRADQGVTLLEGMLQKNNGNPDAYIALSQMYSDANRGAQAVKLLQDAQSKFPSESSVIFQLASVLEKQRKFSESEALFRQIIAREPEHAAALNYLGYMLADRGEKLDESVGLIRRALELEPDNGSYLDSLGWAYFKIGQLALAEEHLKRAADQMTTNSVVQDHYGDVLARLGRFDQAIAAWNRALSGDGDSIERSDIDRKIRSARQKLPKR
jgi:tetratricopeptide (TPR) repeat protein